MSFQGRIGLNVTGLIESIRGIEGAIRDFPRTKMDALREGADFFAQNARANAHRISGKTANSIKVDSVTDKQATISAGFGMPFEEKREGEKGGTPHRTFSEAAKTTGMVFPTIFRKHFNNLLARNKTR
jgi:hypothetical protein